MFDGSWSVEKSKVLQSRLLLHQLLDHLTPRALLLPACYHRGVSRLSSTPHHDYQKHQEIAVLTFPLAGKGREGADLAAETEHRTYQGQLAA